jgi:hypothetical protein
MEILEALVSVGLYNGHEEVLRRISDHIRHAPTKKYGKQANFPQWLHNEFPDTDNYARVFWSTLVEAYGCCGTSPRFGWIERVDECIEMLDKVLAAYKPVEAEVE